MRKPFAKQTQCGRFGDIQGAKCQILVGIICGELADADNKHK